MRQHFLTHVRQLLQSFAEAGQPSISAEFQPLIGPNGPLEWTRTAGVDRRQPFTDAVFATRSSPEQLPPKARAGIHRPQAVDAPLKASADQIPQPAGTSA
jgi:hypothetical protein